MDLISFAALPLILQIVLIIHAIKNQKPYFWIFLLIFVPGISTIIYFLIEFLPSILNRPDARLAGKQFIKAINPEGDIRRLKEQLESQDTIANKIALADAYFEAEQYENAVVQYKECLVGPYANDRTILFPLARAQYFAGNIEEAKKIVHLLKEEKEFVLFEEQLLDLQIREVDENVLQDFENLYERTRNFEAGFYYVKSLIKNNQVENAKRVIADMKNTLKNFSKFRTTIGKEWLSKSESVLRSL